VTGAAPLGGGAGPRFPGIGDNVRVGDRGAVTPRDGRALRLGLLVLGALLSLTWAAGWTVAGLANDHAPDGALPAVLYAVGQILSVLAAPAWFALCLWLARTPGQLIGWGIAGLVLLAPLPVLVGSA